MLLEKTISLQLCHHPHWAPGHSQCHCPRIHWPECPTASSDMFDSSNILRCPMHQKILVLIWDDDTRASFGKVHSQSPPQHDHAETTVWQGLSSHTRVQGGHWPACFQRLVLTSDPSELKIGIWHWHWKALIDPDSPALRAQHGVLDPFET